MPAPKSVLPWGVGVANLRLDASGITTFATHLIRGTIIYMMPYDRYRAEHDSHSLSLCRELHVASTPRPLVARSHQDSSPSMSLQDPPTVRVTQ